MRNYVEVEKRVFIGEFANWVGNRSNTKRPSVNLLFFTRPNRFQDVDPEAGCDMKVGLWSHNLMSGVVRVKRHDATSESVVGRRTKLLNGFVGTPLAGRFTASLPGRGHQTTGDATRQARFSREAVPPMGVCGL